MKNNETYNIKVLTLFPEMFPGSLGYSLAGKARKNKVWNLDIVNIRDYADDKYGTVDDVPYGGGPGMILKPDVLGRAYDSNTPDADWKKIVLTPRGKPLTQKMVQKMTSCKGLLIVCGRYEGLDERFIESKTLK
jgi:tRNA (guanine37-N1)-methyltransferase